MKKTILVLYYTRGVYPLRDAIRTHLYCWKRYGSHRVAYLNVAFGYPTDLVRRLNPDVVILHTIFLSMRWSKLVFEKFTGICADLANLRCTKIALPQDEFIHTDMLAEYLARIGVTHIGSCAYEEEWRKIYRRLWEIHPNAEKVAFRTVLTGYLDEDTVTRIERMKRHAPPRDIDLGYRAWRAQYWLGEHGMHKVWVAERLGKACAAAGLRTDISLRDEDVLNGDGWFRFLLRCRATVGVEGGASVCDHDGSIKGSVEAFLKEHPTATFEETRNSCFADRDYSLGLACISPRHLEACATETCQALVEGRYSDILVAGRDYIPVKRDYSNLTEVVSELASPERTQVVAKAAYDNVVRAGRWTYLAFVREIEKSIIDPAPLAEPIIEPGNAEHIARKLNMRDWLIWRFIQLEVAASTAIKPTIARKIVSGAYQTTLKALGIPLP